MSDKAAAAAAIEHMADACARHLSTAESLLVAMVTLEHPARMIAYFDAAATVLGSPVKPAVFAAYALKCAKQIRDGAAS